MGNGEMCTSLSCRNLNLHMCYKIATAIASASVGKTIKFEKNHFVKETKAIVFKQEVPNIHCTKFHPLSYGEEFILLCLVLSFRKE